MGFTRTLIVAGNGITVVNGSNVSLNSTFYGYLNNANLASGVVVASGAGVVAARFIPYTDTQTAINAFVGSAGELATDGTSVRLFNGVQPGGFPVNLNSSSCRFVSGNGSENENGIAFYNMVAALHTLTPNGAARSASNPAIGLLGPGVYNLVAAAGNLDFNSAGIVLIGIGGSAAVKVKTDATHRLRIVVQDGASIVYPTSCTNHSLVGITFQSVDATPGSSITWLAKSFTSGTPAYSFYHEDLDFPGLTTAQSAMGYDLTSNTVTTTVTGRVFNVRTSGRGLYGGWTTGSIGSEVIIIDYQVGFEDCSAAGDRSFGGGGSALGTRIGGVTTPGYLKRCRSLGTTDGYWNCKLNAPMTDCDWGAPIERLGSSAEVYDSRIRGLSGANSLQNDSGVTCRVSGCKLAGAIGGNITNSIGGTIDSAGNLPDAQFA